LGHHQENRLLISPNLVSVQAVWAKISVLVLLRNPGKELSLDLFVGIGQVFHKDIAVVVWPLDQLVDH
jgi:hypothetical protein